MTTWCGVGYYIMYNIDIYDYNVDTQNFYKMLSVLLYNIIWINSIKTSVLSFFELSIWTTEMDLFIKLKSYFHYGNI